MAIAQNLTQQDQQAPLPMAVPKPTAAPATPAPTVPTGTQPPAGGYPGQVPSSGPPPALPMAPASPTPTPMASTPPALAGVPNASTPSAAPATPAPSLSNQNLTGQTITGVDGDPTDIAKQMQSTFVTPPLAPLSGSSATPSQNPYDALSAAQGGRGTPGSDQAVNAPRIPTANGGYIIGADGSIKSTAGAADQSAQARLNAANGLTLNPTTGAYDNAATRLVNSGPTSYYNYDPTVAGSSPGTGVVAQSLNGGALTGPGGLPLAGAPAGSPPPASASATPNPLNAAGTGTGAASGTAGSGIPLPMAAPSPTTATSAQVSPAMGSPLPMASTSTTGANGGVGLSNQNLTGQTITGVNGNPTDIAKQIQSTFAQQTDPQYQANIREAISNGSALGQLGSGGLRTSVGNLANARDLQLQGQSQALQENALQQQLQQNQFNTGVAQQQQGFQAGQQGTAFDQAAQQAQLQEALTNGDFNRYLELLNAGQSGDPNLALAGDYGQQAAGAGAAAGGLVGNATNNANQQQTLQQYQAMLAAMQGGQPQPQLPMATPSTLGNVPSTLQFPTSLSARGTNPLGIGG